MRFSIGLTKVRLHTANEKSVSLLKLCEAFNGELLCHSQ